MAIQGCIDQLPDDWVTACGQGDWQTVDKSKDWEASRLNAPKRAENTPQAERCLQKAVAPDLANVG